MGGHAKRHSELCEHLDKIHNNSDPDSKTQLKEMLKDIIARKDSAYTTTSKIQARLKEQDKQDGVAEDNQPKGGSGNS